MIAPPGAGDCEGRLLAESSACGRLLAGPADICTLRGSTRRFFAACVQKISATLVSDRVGAITQKIRYHRNTNNSHRHPAAYRNPIYEHP